MAFDQLSHGALLTEDQPSYIPVHPLEIVERRAPRDRERDYPAGRDAADEIEQLVNGLARRTFQRSQLPDQRQALYPAALEGEESEPAARGLGRVRRRHHREHVALDVLERLGHRARHAIPALDELKQDPLHGSAPPVAFALRVAFALVHGSRRTRGRARVSRVQRGLILEPFLDLVQADGPSVFSPRSRGHLVEERLSRVLGSFTREVTSQAGGDGLGELAQRETRVGIGRRRLRDGPGRAELVYARASKSSQKLVQRAAGGLDLCQQTGSNDAQRTFRFPSRYLAPKLVPLRREIPRRYGRRVRTPLAYAVGAWELKHRELARAIDNLRE